MSLPLVQPSQTQTTPAADLLAGRVILVTGASGGLGGAVARASAAAGATVVLTGRKARPLEKLYDELVASGAPTPAIVPLDLEQATPDQYAEVAETLRKEFGQLDGLVHGATHFDALTPVGYHPPDGWLRALQVNLSAPFALTQACLPLLEASADSAVIFIGDDPNELEGAYWGAYSVSKAGLERFATILHDEHDSGPLRVHMLLPGPMRTSLRRKAWFGEDTMQQPTPAGTASIVARMLSPEGSCWRGSTLDLRNADR